METYTKNGMLNCGFLIKFEYRKCMGGCWYTDRWINRWTEREKDRWMIEWIDRYTEGWKNG